MARVPFGMIVGPSVAEMYDANAQELTSYAQRIYEESREVSKADFVEGFRLQGERYRPLGRFLEKYNALACPTSAVPACPADYDLGQPCDVAGEPVRGWMEVMMTVPFNIASRCPVMSVSLGRARRLMPTGLSIAGPTYDDTVVLRIASASEAVEPWFASPDNRPVL